ncbi:Kinesin-like protein kif21b [Nowakowskiella sp. JEL0407]|nr:Kinesin-like protein kif21b [Nowakowskiella sp. JEL0407]
MPNTPKNNDFLSRLQMWEQRESQTTSSVNNNAKQSETADKKRDRDSKDLTTVSAIQGTPRNAEQRKSALGRLESVHKAAKSKDSIVLNLQNRLGCMKIEEESAEINEHHNIGETCVVKPNPEFADMVDEIDKNKISSNSTVCTQSIALLPIAASILVHSPENELDTPILEDKVMLRPEFSNETTQAFAKISKSSRSTSASSATSTSSVTSVNVSQTLSSHGRKRIPSQSSILAPPKVERSSSTSSQRTTRNKSSKPNSTTASSSTANTSSPSATSSSSSSNTLTAKPRELASSPSMSSLRSMVSNQSSQSQVEYTPSSSPVFTPADIEILGEIPDLAPSQAFASSVNAAGASVQVALRIRPFSESERENSAITAVHIGIQNPLAVSVMSEQHITNCGTNSRREDNTKSTGETAFTFDHVYSTIASQEDVFLSVAPLLQKFLDGFNATVLAYGQTGSGKTYTMGSMETASRFDTLDETQLKTLGVIPRASRLLFTLLEKEKNSDPYFTYNVHVSFLELYNEDLNDLLAVPVEETDATPGWNNSFSAKNPGKKRPPGVGNILIRESKDGSIGVTGLEERTCMEAEDILKYLNMGSTLRRTSATNANLQSSRSHAIFTIHLLQQRQLFTSDNNAALKTHSKSSKFHFVDLAGSERLKRTNATGDRQKEGIAINGGLLALGKVISALADKENAHPKEKEKDGAHGESFHIPYRNSKLTRILKDSLGGNSQTLMIACISPAIDDLGETRSTMRYAARARHIKNNATVNSQEDATKAEQLKIILGRVNEELRTVRKSSEFKINELEKMIRSMQAKILQTTSEYHLALSYESEKAKVLQQYEEERTIFRTRNAEAETRLEELFISYSQLLADHHLKISYDHEIHNQISIRDGEIEALADELFRKEIELQQSVIDNHWLLGFKSEAAHLQQMLHARELECEELNSLVQNREMQLGQVTADYYLLLSQNPQMPERWYEERLIKLCSRFFAAVDEFGVGNSVDLTSLKLHLQNFLSDLSVSGRIRDDTHRMWLLSEDPLYEIGELLIKRETQLQQSVADFHLLQSEMEFLQHAHASTLSQKQSEIDQAYIDQQLLFSYWSEIYQLYHQQVTEVYESIEREKELESLLRARDSQLAQLTIDQHLQLSYQGEINQLMKQESENFQATILELERRLAQTTIDHHLYQSYQSELYELRNLTFAQSRELSDRISEIESLKSRLQNQITADSQLILSYLGEIKGLKSEIKEQKRELRRQQVENKLLYEESKMQIEKRDEKIETLHTTMENDRAAFLNSEESLKAEIQVLLSDIENKRNEIADKISKSLDAENHYQQVLEELRGNIEDTEKQLADKNDLLSQTVNEAQTNLKQYEESKRAFQQEIDRLNSELTHSIQLYENAVKSAEQASRKHAEAVQVFETRISTLEKDLKTCEEELALANENGRSLVASNAQNVEKYETQLSDLNAKLHEASNQYNLAIANAEGAAKENAHTCATLRNQIEQLEQSFGLKSSEFEQYKNVSETTVEKQKISIHELEVTITQLREKGKLDHEAFELARADLKSELNETVSSFESKLANLISKHETLVNELNQRIQALSDEVKEEKQEGRRKNAEIMMIEQELMDYRRKLDSAVLKSKELEKTSTMTLTEKEERNRALAEDIKILEAKLNDITEEKRQLLLLHENVKLDLQVELDRLTAEKKEAEISFASWKSEKERQRLTEVNNFQRQISELNQSIELLKDEKSRTESFAQEVSQKLSKLEIEFIRVEDEMSQAEIKYEAQISSANNEYHKLEIQFNESQATILRHINVIASLEDSTKNLQSELQNLNDELARSVEEHRATESKLSQNVSDLESILSVKRSELQVKSEELAAALSCVRDREEQVTQLIDTHQSNITNEINARNLEIERSNLEMLKYRSENEAAIAVLMKQIETLNVEIRTLHDVDLHNANEKLREREKEKAELHVEYDALKIQLENEIVRHKNELFKRSAEYDDSLRELGEQHNKRVNLLEESIGRLKETVLSLEKENSDAEVVAGDLSARIIDLENSLKQANDTTSRNESDHQGVLITMREKQHSLEEELEGVRNTVKDQAETICSLEKTLGETKSELEEGQLQAKDRTEMIARLEKDLRETNAELENVQVKGKERTERISSLEKVLSEQKAELESVQIKIKERTETIVSLEKTLDETNSKLHFAHDKYSKLVASHEAAVESHSAVNIALQNQLSTTASELNAKHAELSELQSKLDLANQSLEKTKEDLANQIRTHQENDTKNAEELERIKNEYATEVGNLNSEIEVLKAEISKLVRDSSNFKMEYEQTRNLHSEKIRSFEDSHQQSRFEFEFQIQTLKEQHQSTVKSERETYESQINALDERLKQAVQDNRTTIERFEVDHSKLLTQIDSLRQKLSESNGINAQLEDSILQLNHELGETRKKSMASEMVLTMELRALQERLNQLTVDQHLAMSYMGEERTSHAESVTELTSKIEECNARYRAALSILKSAQNLPLPPFIQEDLDQQLKARELNLDEKTMNDDSIPGDNETFFDEPPPAPLDVYESLILDLEARLADVTASQELASVEVIRKEAEIAALREELDRLRETLTKLNDEYVERCKEVNQQRVDIDDMQALLKHNEFLLGENDEEILMLRRIMQQAVVDHHLALSKVEEMRRRLEDKIQTLSNDLISKNAVEMQLNQITADYHLLISISAENESKHRDQLSALTAKVAEVSEFANLEVNRLNGDLLSTKKMLNEELERAVQIKMNMKEMIIELQNNFDRQTAELSKTVNELQVTKSDFDEIALINKDLEQRIGQSTVDHHLALSYGNDANMLQQRMTERVKELQLELDLGNAASSMHLSRYEATKLELDEQRVICENLEKRLNQTTVDYHLSLSNGNPKMLTTQEELNELQIALASANENLSKLSKQLDETRWKLDEQKMINDQLEIKLNQSTIDHHLTLSYSINANANVDALDNQPVRNIETNATESEWSETKLREQKRIFESQINQITLDHHLTLSYQIDSNLIIRDLKAEIAMIRSKLEDSEKAVPDLVNRISETEMRLKARDEYLRNTIMDTAHRQQELEQQLHDMTSRCEELDHSLQLTKAENERLKMHVSELDADNQALQSEISQMVVPRAPSTIMRSTPEVTSPLEELIEEFVILRDIGTQCETQPEPSVSETQLLSVITKLTFAEEIRHAQEETIKELEEKLELSVKEIERFRKENWDLRLQKEQVTTVSSSREKVIDELLLRIDNLESEATASKISNRLSILSTSSTDAVMRLDSLLRHGANIRRGSNASITKYDEEFRKPSPKPERLNQFPLERTPTIDQVPYGSSGRSGNRIRSGSNPARSPSPLQSPPQMPPQLPPPQLPPPQLPPPQMPPPQQMPPLPPHSQYQPQHPYGLTFYPAWQLPLAPPPNNPLPQPPSSPLIPTTRHLQPHSSPSQMFIAPGSVVLTTDLMNRLPIEQIRQESVDRPRSMPMPRKQTATSRIFSNLNLGQGR